MPAGEVRAGDVADLAGVDEGIEGVEGLLNRREGVEAVHVVDVDVVGAEALEAGVALLENVLARGARVIGPLAHWEKRLRRDEPSIAFALERLAEDLLGQTIGIAIGDVEKVDAGIDAEIDHAAG